MLKIPSWRTFPEHRVTAYQDDTMFWKYYLIPEVVRVRKDENGKPVFLLIAYAFSDQDRAADPTLPKGGGFMVMDVELRVPDEAMAPIVEQLQKDTDELWRQLKALAEGAGKEVRGARLTSRHHMDGERVVSLGVNDVLLGLGADAPEAPPGNAPPKVIIADPTWSEGTFRISAPQSDKLVANRLAEGPLSLVGTNVAAANLDLTAAGADFMVQTLVNPDGGGAGDLTPIQVQYQMKFWARTPPVAVNASADSRSLYASIKSIYHDYSDGGCDESSIEHSEQHLQMAISSGLVKIRTDVGDPDTPQDVVNQIRSDAVKTLQQMLTEKFFDRKPPAQPADDKTKDFVDRESDVYFLKTEATIDFAHFEYNEVLSSVRKWPVNPQGTMQSFLHGLSPAEVSQFVRKIKLNDPFFQTLNLTVEMHGVTWETDPVDFVEVELTYKGDGSEEAKSTSAVFTKDTKTFKWDPGLIGKVREYSYRWRVGYRGHGASDWSKPERTATNHLALQVAAPGKVEVTFQAGNVDFTNTTDSIQIHVEYEDRTHGVVKDGTTLVLNGGVAEKSYSRWIFVPQQAELRYRTTFFLKNGQQIDVPFTSTTADQVVVNLPRSDNRLDARLIPTGDWAGVTQSVVTLRYTDPMHQINAEGMFQLKNADEFRSWIVYTADGGHRKFEYKMVTAFGDGTSDEKEWVELTGDQTIQLKVKAPPVLEVTVIPQLLDFAVTPVVEVSLSYEDPANQIIESKTFALTKPEPEKWRVPLRDNSKRGFTSKITYNKADGQVVNRVAVKETDDKLTVPKLLVPEVFGLMVPKLIDFTKVPLVEVHVKCADGQEDTFIFTEPKEQQFRFQVPEGVERSYNLDVTYHLADGGQAVREPVKLSQSKVVIPAPAR